MTPFARRVLIGVVLLFILFVAGFLVLPPYCVYPQWQANERSARTSLKVLVLAQSDFFAKDRDENQIQDFWRADVAGLYTTKYKGELLKLIEFSCAVADDRPITPAGPRAPKSGYWYRALRFSDETKPDPNRFAFCAFPDEAPKTGRSTFIISDREVVFRKELGKGRGIEVWPQDPEKEGWSKVD